MKQRVTCRVLTLYQPWATAVALRLKTIETRNWGTRYRGALGIHAGKRWDKAAEAFMPREVVERAAGERGALLAVATLADVFEYATAETWKAEMGAHLCPLHYWEPGKHGWRLEEIRGIVPVPISGAMGLWNFEGEVEFMEE